MNSTGLPSTSAPRANPTTAAVPTSSAQQSNAVRPPVKSSTGPTGRPSSTPQSGQQHFSQPRGGGAYYGQNNRNNHWNDALQKEHNPARRSGPNAIAAPNENQVFVGSLPAEFTPAILTECFSKFGRVLDAKIHSANGDNKKVGIDDCRALFEFDLSSRTSASWLLTIQRRHRKSSVWNMSRTVTPFF